MKTAAIVTGFVIVAAAAFLAGRYTAPCAGTGSPEAPSPAAVAPAAPAPSAAPVAAQKPQPAPAGGLRLDSINVQPAGGPPPVFQPAPPANAIVIPPGTKPAADASPAVGPEDAKVIVLEVSDFQCPVCKRAYFPLKQLQADFPGGAVRLVFKQNPLDMHRNAMNAAAASMAAARQKKFWEMADVLFNNQGNLTEAELYDHARTAGLDAAKFKKDYEDVALRALAKQEGADATAQGAQGTPAFFVNGRKEVGWASYEAVKQQVQQEISAVDALVAQGRTVKQARIERVKANLGGNADAFLKSTLGREF